MNSGEVNANDGFDIFEFELEMALKLDKAEDIHGYIKDGLDVNRVMKNTGCPMLIQAVANYCSSVVSELIAAGANINMSDEYGDTALHFAAQLNDLDTVRLLIDAGADINRCGEGGSTPLHLTDCGNCQNLLVSNGADPTIKNDMGLSVDDMNALRVEQRIFSGLDYNQAVGTMNIYLETDQRASEQRDVIQQAIEESGPGRQTIARRM
ncbi:ankyrin repeat domain-containing protein [Stenotrophomonas sp. S39]|nr:ankyrin repeat domain-containing protein [Stenotrophomonas sp. S39]